MIIHLSTPVASIEQSSSSVTVTASDGRAFHARRAILAIPSTLHNTIAFRGTPAPGLPPAKQRLADAAASTGAFFAKATLVYDRPWWRDNEGTPAGPLNGIFESVLGPIIYSRNTNVPALGHWSITGSVVGAPGARWGAIADREGRRRAVVEQLRNGFGAVLGEGGGRERVPEPLAYVEGLWTGEYAGGGGSVPVLGPGVLTAVGRAAAEPFGRVHFVGSETAEAWRGYMEGAVRSGLRGAEEVVAALGKEREGGLQAAGKL
ncbi:hypothetical protein SLS55_010011 [Diplodia seriata]|uniref:Amine oxidase n=1 Tax=Diplodia seriata TaxID=420778 RepID=A0ABR3C1P3_9PEZI